MKFTSTIIALVAFAATFVYARPNGSPLCDTTGAGAKIAASAMGSNLENLNTSCTWTADSSTYSPGSSITFSVSCASDFKGILLYVAGASDPTKKVGTFEIASGYQNDKSACGDLSENDNSSVTHTSGQTYSASSSYKYTAPSSDVGTLTLHAIIVKTSGDGYAWGVFAAAATVASSGSTAESPSTTTTGSGSYGTADSSYSCDCPSAQTSTLVRKCKPKTNAVTTINFTTTKMVTDTTTTTEISTTTMTETSTMTDTVTKTVTTCSTTSSQTVLGNEETPTSSTTTTTCMASSKTTTTTTPTAAGEEETTTANDSYGGCNGYGCDSSTTTSDSSGSYGYGY